MITTFRRAGAAFGLLALISVVAAAPANAATPTGVGTSGGTASLVDVDYGDIIKATLLGESNSDTIDPLNGTPTATETLSPLVVHSVAVPALDAATVPPIQTTTTGAQDQKSTALVDLSTLGVPGLTGAIDPATLTSLVDTNGARSALASTLANLDALGLLSVDSVALDLGGLAAPGSATANRSLTADAITVLDLQALLNLLGLDISDLSIDTVLGLLDQLDELGIVEGITHIVGTDSAADFADKLDQLSSGITSADGALSAANTALAAAQTVHTAALTACNVIVDLNLKQACIDAADAALAAVQTTVDSAQDALDVLQGLLDQLLETMFGVLAGTPLVAIDGVTVGAVATAKDTVANSSAIVTGAINDIRVGGLDLGGLDANATLDQVEALGTSLVDTLNGALAQIDPSLGSLISIDLLHRATSVAQSGDYVNAVAGITALALTITPPDLCDLLNSVLGNGADLPEGVTLPDSPVSDVLGEIGSLVPACIAVDEVQRLAPQAVGGFPALVSPITFKAATVNSASTFKTVAAPATPATPNTPALPRTGMNETLLLIVGGLMAAAALGIRRVSLDPERAQTR